MQTMKSNVNQANDSTLMLQVSNDLTVQVTKNSTYEYLMTTTEVAHGYDCSSEAIFMAKKRNPNDLVEGKHFIQGSDKLLGDTPNSLLGVGIKPNQLFWTKRGIIRLGFMLTSSRAVLFRDWAEDLIIDKMQSKYRLRFNDDEEKLLAIINHYLIKGDVVAIANELNITAKHVSRVKKGRCRSHNVMQALVNKAKHNLDNKIVDGYKNTFVQTSLDLFNTKTTAL